MSGDAEQLNSWCDIKQKKEAQVTDPVTDFTTKPSRPKRTQAQRSRSMQKRLLDATIKCLSVEGYAGTTISKIAKYADTSNGTPLHHFSNKAAIIESAAAKLISDIARDTAQMFDASNTDFVDGIEEVKRFIEDFSHKNALMEILQASKRDEALRQVIQPVFLCMGQEILTKSERWFEVTNEDHDLREILTIFQWVVRGMAIDAHLLKNDKARDYAIKMILKMFADYLKRRKT